MLTTPAIASQTPADAEIEVITCTKQFYEQKKELRKKLEALKRYVLESSAEVRELSRLAPKEKELIEFYLNEKQHTVDRMAAAFITLADSIVDDAKIAGCHKIVGFVQGIKPSIQNLPDLLEK